MSDKIVGKKLAAKISENFQKKLIEEMVKENCHKNYQNNCEKIIARKNFPKNF